ncbi:PARP-type domain-containing protein (Fragment) [Durusdinium trenchii]|uniref:PARP-type domain-containing protein n=1 Tax=Durusdinium trenchii TaxID=1381693 RepID=A0ABP0SS47_9DINO
MDADTNYAAKNSVRKRLICEELSSPDFHKNVYVIDSLLQPFELGINYCFARTAILHELTALGSDHPRHNDLLQQSRGKFLHVVRGDLGRDVIQGFMQNLKYKLHDAIEIGLGGDVEASYLQNVFSLIIVCSTDSWRRLIYVFDQPPFSLFRTVGVSTEDFVEAWSGLHDKFQSCTSCVDPTFTAVLLKAFPRLFSDSSQGEQEAVQKQVQDLLLDISGWCPLTSDLCEIRNGNIQWLTSRRGNTHLKGTETSIEESLLQQLINTHEWAQHVLEPDTMPTRLTASSIRKMVGTKSSNQFTKSVGKDAVTLARWNIFQKHKLQEQGLVDPLTYKKRVKELSHEWAQLSETEKEAFKLQAAHEQSLREKLAVTPLITKAQKQSASMPDSATAIKGLEEQIGRKGCKLLSSRRLCLNEALHRESGVWQSETRLDDSDGAFKADLIDLTTSDEVVQHFLQDTILQQPTCTDASQLCQLPDQCLEICGSNPQAQSIKTLVQNFQDALKKYKLLPGALLSFHTDFCHRTATCFLGVTLQKPKMQTLMYAEINNAGRVNFIYKDGVPVFGTTAELFALFLQDLSSSVAPEQDICLKVDVCEYNVTWVDGHQLVASSDSVSGSFDISLDRTVHRKRKLPGKLPFGFKLRKNKKRLKGKESGKKIRSSKKIKQAAQPDSQQSQDLINNSSDENNSNTDSVSGSAASDADVEADVPLESEPIDPISDVVAHEEQACRTLQSEIQESVQARAEVGEAYASGKAMPKTTFFSRELGLDGGGLAASGRSMCLQCKAVIRKGEVRFSWYWNQLRPHAWLHSHCLVPITESTGLKERTVTKLMELSQESSDCPATVREKATSILKVYS